MKQSSTRTLQEIIDTKFNVPQPLVERLFSPGETALFIARQKEGKSTLALQLVIDVACGDSFLGQYSTIRTNVLYVDYENRPYQIKRRAQDLAMGRRVDKVHVEAYENISARRVGLYAPEEFAQLEKLVREHQPGLLVIDPLRYALSGETTEEQVVLKAIDRVSQLQEIRPGLSTILIHHLKKKQSDLKIRLLKDPRSWIDQVYGSQALLAHVETTWGLEIDGDGYVFATVPRSQQPLVIRLEKMPESEKFLFSPWQAQTDCFTSAQKEAWQKLPDNFTWTEGLACGVANSTLNRVIRGAQAAGLLTQDRQTKRYTKVKDSTKPVEPPTLGGDQKVGLSARVDVPEEKVVDPDELVSV